MNTEKSHEPRLSSQPEQVSSDAVDWLDQFTKFLKIDFLDSVGDFRGGATQADFQRFLFGSTIRTLQESGARQETIRDLLADAIAGLADLPESSLDVHLAHFDSSWDALSDESRPIAQRVAALWAGALTAECRMASYVAEQLVRPDITRPWQDALVLCAETLQFQDDEVRDHLWRRLLEIALQRRRDPDDTASRPIVSSAIRCVASMIPVNEVPQFLPLLDPPDPLETRLVTLQAIVNVFELGPPTADNRLGPLRERVHELALKFLDRDWLVAGERAAIALNAVQALACLGEVRLTDCISRVVALRVNWFTRQLRQRLQETAQAWELLDDCTSRRLLHDQLSTLQEALASANCS